MLSICNFNVRSQELKCEKDAVIQTRVQREDDKHPVTFELNPVFELNVLDFIPRPSIEWVASARLDIQPTAIAVKGLRDLEKFLSTKDPWSEEVYLEATKHYTLYEEGLSEYTKVKLVRIHSSSLSSLC